MLTKTGEAEWSRFCGGLMAYISAGKSHLIKTDYEVHISMSDSEILNELWKSEKIEDLSSELKQAAKDYKKKYIDK